MADSSEGSRKGQGRVSLAPAERRRRRRDWRLALAIGVGLFVLVAVEQQILRLSHRSPIGSDAILLALLHVNVIGTGVLVFLIGRNIVKLVIERRRGILGSRLNTKFVVSFVFVAAISTTVLFAFSSVLVSRAIDSWLEVEVGESLGDALAISDAIYDRAEASSLSFARRLAKQIEERRLLREDALDALRGFIADKQLEYDLGSVEVVSARREMLARATHPDVPIVAFERPGSELIDAALQGLERTHLARAGAGELIRGAVPIHSTFQSSEVVGVVVVNAFVPRAIGGRVEVVRRALQSYRRLQPSQGALRTSLVLLLAMVALSILLFASWIGFRLAKQVTGPIQELALAAHQIAAGNLEVQVHVGARDELGMLMAAFNQMASDLAVSREDLEQRRAQMEIILRSVAAGVLSIDRDGRLMTINPSALRLLGIKRDPYAGRKLAEVLPASALETVESMLRRLAAGPHATLRRQAALGPGEQSRILHWTASELRDLDQELSGFVIVLDDVTQLSRAQRMSAWRELARRIAHEIKNPLTPIQLAAQRLRRKLGSQLADDASRELLNRYTDAITS
ncbi:MAG: PAS domain-containing protein, partial [Myxococcota bacterium]